MENNAFLDEFFDPNPVSSIVVWKEFRVGAVGKTGKPDHSLSRRVATSALAYPNSSKHGIHFHNPMPKRGLAQGCQHRPRKRRQEGPS